MFVGTLDRCRIGSEFDRTQEVRGSIPISSTRGKQEGIREDALFSWEVDVDAVVVYVLRGSKGRRYVGITNNLARRLGEHRKGNVGRLIGEFQVLHTESLPDHAAARERERFLKSGKGRQWLDEIEARQGPPKAGKAIP